MPALARALRNFSMSTSSLIIEPSGFGKTRSDGDSSIAYLRNGRSSVAIGIASSCWPFVVLRS
jgi:hypothetical protein